MILRICMHMVINYKTELKFQHDLNQLINCKDVNTFRQTSVYTIRKSDILKKFIKAYGACQLLSIN